VIVTRIGAPALIQWQRPRVLCVLDQGGKLGRLSPEAHPDLRRGTLPLFVVPINDLSCLSYVRDTRVAGVVTIDDPLTIDHGRPAGHLLRLLIFPNALSPGR